MHRKPGENVNITHAAWHQEVAGDPHQPLPDRLQGREGELLRTLEDGGPDAVRLLVESWGLVWKVGPHGAITVDLPETGAHPSTAPQDENTSDETRTG